jgi:hypothetical protein
MISSSAKFTESHITSSLRQAATSTIPDMIFVQVGLSLVMRADRAPFGHGGCFASPPVKFNFTAELHFSDRARA